jgi:hypothetical protein
MIAALLGWTKLPQWALELIVIAAAVGAVFYWQHHLIDEGVNKQKAADATELQKLKTETDQKSAELQAKATTAEQAYDKEHADNLNYRDSHPTGPVRLCLATNQGSGAMPTGQASKPGNVGASSSSADVPKVSGRDNSSGGGTPGPDISKLLGLLAVKADNVSSTLREFQSR